MSNSPQASAAKAADQWFAGLSRALSKDSRSITTLAREAGVGVTTLRAWRDGRSIPSLANAVLMRDLLNDSWPKNIGGRI